LRFGGYGRHFIEEDQYLHPHIISALALARKEELVNIVENEAGVLF